MLVSRQLKSTSPQGLNHESMPMRLWQKAKKLGIWNPQDIDFSQDREDWMSLDDLEREVLMHLSSNFLGGEESVTLDLLPMISVIASEGRLEEEMYLTSFLWEEAKHVEAMSRYLDEVVQDRTDLTRFETDSYKRLFHDELPTAMNRLKTDQSPVALAEASVTYNMIVEGVAAETGYHAYFSMLEANDIMPGMMEMVTYLQQDESRHLAYGTFLLSRLVAEHGDVVWKPIQKHMAKLLPIALGMLYEGFARYEKMPFDLSLTHYVGYATSQHSKRLKRIEKARKQTLEEVLAS